jgi:hypothetical protein
MPPLPRATVVFSFSSMPPPFVRRTAPCDAISCCTLYVVQRHVTRPYHVAPERVHKSHFRSFIVQCHTTLSAYTNVTLDHSLCNVILH